MNFYIGNSIDEIDEQDVNIEFSDELIDFIYKMSGRVSFDMSKLYKIDPYDDVEVSKNDLSPIAKICKYILDSTLLQDYEEPDEGRQMLQDLLEIIQKDDDKRCGTGFNRRLIICIMLWFRRWGIIILWKFD